MRTIVDIVPNHVSDQHPWFRDAPRLTARLARAGALLVPARRAGPTARRRRTGGSRSSAAPAWTRDRASGGEWYLHLFAPEQPDLNWTHPDVWAEHEDILRFWFDRGVAGVRIDSAALLVKHPDLAEHDRRRRSRRAPVHRPGRAARHLPPLARDRRRLRRAARSRRRGVAPRPGPARPLPPPGRAAHRVQLRLPRVPVGPRTDAHVDRVGARLARPGRRPGDLGALEPRRDEAGHALRPGRHVVLVRGEARGHPDRPRARHAARAGGGAARDGAARLAVRLPGRGARAARGRGHPARSAARTRCGTAPAASTPAATAAGSRCPGTATGRRTASADDGRRPALARPARRLGGAHGRRAVRAHRRRCSPSTAAGLRFRRAAPWSATGRSAGCPRTDAVLAFARGERFACIVNFGPDPVELPAGADVLIASNELEGGALPHDTTVWLRQPERIGVGQHGPAPGSAIGARERSRTMKSTHRAMTVAVAVASLLASAAGRGRGREERSAAEAKVTISVASLIPGSTPAAVKQFENQVKQFEKANPNDRREAGRVPVDRPDVRRQARRPHAADGLRGAVHRRPDARRARPARRPDRARSRSCRTSRSYNPAVLAEATTSKGKIVALPKGAYAQALHYNRKLFSAGRASTRTSRRRRGRRCGLSRSRSRSGPARPATLQMGKDDNTAGWILTTLVVLPRRPDGSRQRRERESDARTTRRRSPRSTC